VSRHICPMLDRFIHLETIVLHCIKVFHVLEHNAGPVDPRLALKLHVRLVSASQLGFDKVACLVDFDWRFLHF